jgi:enterochelin esterase-like enzyme
LKFKKKRVANAINFAIHSVMPKVFQNLTIETISLNSPLLEREVTVDFYLPKPFKKGQPLSLLLLNDGQDMVMAKLSTTLEDMYAAQEIMPLMVVGIHCGKERIEEYGTAFITDYKDRGKKAKAYQAFIFNELMPFIRNHFAIPEFKDKSFAGFSMGALSALDIVWNYAPHFKRVGVFSGSLWWRSKSSKGDSFEEDKDRIMHQQIRASAIKPWLEFYFQVGAQDESEDRNNNGVIDSIDDTQDLIKELEEKGYRQGLNIKYVLLPDGKHDVPTWGRALPDFLKWGWGISQEVMH